MSPWQNTRFSWTQMIFDHHFSLAWQNQIMIPPFTLSNRYGPSQRYTFQTTKLFRGSEKVHIVWVSCHLCQGITICLTFWLSLFRLSIWLRCFDPGSIQGGPGGSYEHHKPSKKTCCPSWKKWVLVLPTIANYCLLPIGLAIGSPIGLLCPPSFKEGRAF